MLGEELTREIYSRIFDGRIPLGSWLRQDALANEFGVSRTPIREAFRALAGQGIVEIIPHRGAYVRGPTPRDVREILEVRAELESFAAALAAKRIRDDQLARLREANQLFRKMVGEFLADDEPIPGGTAAGKAWMTANEQFHAVILEAADNRALRTSVHDLFRRFPRNVTYAALSGHSHLLTRNVEEHGVITAAIEARDEDAARRAMHVHMKRAAELVARWFETELWLDQAHPGAP